MAEDVVINENTSLATSEYGFFVFSSWKIPTTEAFSGLYIGDEQIVLGPEGYKKFRAIDGNAILPHNDGQYFCCTRIEGGFQVFCDFCGLIPLFTYEKNGKWAVSNSFTLLIDHLLDNGIKLVRDAATLKWYNQANARSLMDYNTAVQGINLAPSGSIITITHDGSFHIKQEKLHLGDYSSHLQAGISKWLSVLACIGNHVGDGLVFDLTGGLDSRATLAFALYLRKSKQAAAFDSIGVFTGGGENALLGWEDDVEIAKELRQNFRLDAREKRASPILYTEKDAVWQEYVRRVLGYYSHVRPKLGERPVNEFEVGGLAGGFLRPQMTKKTALTIAIKYAKRHKPIGTKLVQAARILPSLLRLRHKANVGRLELLYFNEFRGRAHFGVCSQMGNTLSPLTSRDLYLAALTIPRKNLNKRQVMYDIITNLASEVLSVRFDDKKKNFSSDHERNFTKISPNITTMQFFAGSKLKDQAYGSDDTPTVQSNSEEFWEHCYNEVQAYGAKDILWDDPKAYKGTAASTSRVHGVLLQKWLSDRGI